MTARPTVALDAEMAAYFARIEDLYPHDAASLALDEQRQRWSAACRRVAAPHPADVAVEEFAIPGPGGRLEMRLYRPPGAGPFPVLLFLHGGGWVLGGFDTHDGACAGFAELARVLVVYPDYRLAPEHRHPAQVEDCWAALEWILARSARHGGDPARLVIGGDSAGGQLTAALCYRIRDQGGPRVSGQVAIYPAFSADMTTAAYRDNADAAGLTRAEMAFYWEAYLGPRATPAWRDKLAQPLLETDYGRLPPAFIAVAGLDPLRDDGIRFAERLWAAGIATTLRVDPTLAHSYMRARHACRAAAAAFAAIAGSIAGFAYGVRP